MKARHEANRPSGPPSDDAANHSEIARWHQLKAIFLAALEQPVSLRNAFVSEACADEPELMKELLELLASEQAAANFAERPAASLLGFEPQPPHPRLAPATRLGTYEIVAFLSAGGMGEVYRARDTVLDRTVAIKTIGGEMTDPAARRRLIREARHASVLHHPHICTIYEVGESEDRPFIVMQLVEGRPLSDVVSAGPPALETTLQCGIQVADALEHAHQHGIIHRDLKSSNVVLDPDGQAVVLDFGLAKRMLEPAGETPHSSMTSTGLIAGTLSHMPPEVLLGKPADARSDIWALGVLLYELATGDLPFPGRTTFEVSSAILDGAPRRIGKSVPLPLRLVIARCLVKDPDGRYQRAADVRDALDAIRRRRAWPLAGRLLVSARRKTVVASVLALALVGPIGFAINRWYDGRTGRIGTVALIPLENATGDAASDYYADGLSDALINQLGTMAAVRVISKGSAARVASAASTHAEVARRLGADALIEGRLRKAGDRIAVDVRVIEPADGRVLWSDTYERAGAEVLALQADLVRALASEVRLSIRPGARDRVATVRSVNPQAYEEYLKGRYAWNRRTEGSLRDAIGHFKSATDLDPTYAPAYAALADCYNQFGTFMVGTGSPRAYRPLAAAAAIHALQIDPYSAEAHASLGYVRHYDWRFDEAEQEFKRAIELNPSYALAHVWYANLLMSRRRVDEALKEIYTARALDPFSLVVNVNIGWVLTIAHRYDDAVAQLTRTLQLDSMYPQTHWRLATALLHAGRYADAHEHARRFVQLTHRDSPGLAALATVSAKLGRMTEVRAILAELIGRVRSGYVPPPALAGTYIALGNVDSALVWVQRAFDERANYAVYVATDPSAALLQRDVRFQALLKAAGLE